MSTWGGREQTEEVQNTCQTRVSDHQPRAKPVVTEPRGSQRTLPEVVGLRGVSRGGFNMARTTPALTDSELINSDGGYDLGYGGRCRGYSL